jgi:hypothetical protein
MGFEPHLTSLGGPGVGILPSRPGAATASTDFVDTSEGDVKEGMVVPKRAAIREAGRDGLARWAAAQGEWIH